MAAAIARTPRMVAFYMALGTFVATTVAIAVTNSVARNDLWIAVLLGLAGAMFMLDVVAKISRHYAEATRVATRSPD